MPASWLIFFLRAQASRLFSQRNNAYIIPSACIMHLYIFIFLRSQLHNPEEELPKLAISGGEALGMRRRA
jgi:hypothetical protein